jgi:hypothetical protein
LAAPRRPGPWRERDLKMAKAATEQVRAQAAHGDGLGVVEFHIASLASVRACADGLFSSGDPFDLVIVNALKGR